MPVSSASSKVKRLSDVFEQLQISNAIIDAKNREKRNENVIAKGLFYCQIRRKIDKKVKKLFVRITLR